jgi:hypothetical protein
MSVTDPRTRLRALRGWAGPHAAALLDQFATIRRTHPRRALAALLAAVAVTGTSLTAVALAPLPGWTASHQAAIDLDPVAPAAGVTSPSPARQPAGPAGAARAVSPPGPPWQPSGEFVGWAILDLATGTITGSDNMAEVSTTASLIKAWIVADYLRLAAEAGWRPGGQRLDQLEVIIRDSNNEYAKTVFDELGAHESIERLITICRLTDSRPYQDFWSNTQLSPRDTARMGACIADGRAAGRAWTDWLLAQMRAVRGVGDFGIRQAFPPDERSAIATKNGWIKRDYDLSWHVNCLAIGDGWTMGVMLRYPLRSGYDLGYEHGAALCQSLAAEHLLP